MEASTFAGYLRGLDETALTELLRIRADVRTQPVPSGFEQLAQRLNGPDSLVLALQTLDRDAVAVGQAVAALGEAATADAVVRLLDVDSGLVLAAVVRLCARGLAWENAGVVRLPSRLADHWAADVGGGRPVAKIAKSALADDVRAAAQALGVVTDGLRKVELVERLSEVMADTASLAEVVARLPAPARERLDALRLGGPMGYLEYGYGSSGRYGTSRVRPGDPPQMLVGAGLLLPLNGRPELPREVSVAAWLAGSRAALTGLPEPASAAVTAAQVRPAVQAAAQDALRQMTALLDEARSTPIAALKKGGVGPRERSRLGKRLSLNDDALVLWIDLAHAAGLLARITAGYAPTAAYPAWRSAEPGQRWAVLATTWFALEHAPTHRQVDDGLEQPPPLPLASPDGALRRALLGAARGGRSLRSVGTHLDWYFPLHGYDPPQLATEASAAVREAEMLGVCATDVLSELGEHLLDVAAEPDPVAALAPRCAPLLPAAGGSVIVQSDLTAVVSGQPSEAASRLLAAAAVAETRGAAGVWRFTPASVRAAMDAGWTADDLLAELKAVSDRPVPQPLEYLVTDVARRHGTVRVRGMRSCVVADETMVTEILHTRALAKLHLSRVAPTVLSSPFELDEVLARLRAAGLSPVAEDALGTVIVEARPEASAASVELVRVRTRLGAAELAALLAADPDGAAGAAASGSFAELSRLNRHLDDAELTLLADALDNETDVVIAYRDASGHRTIRAIRPERLYGSWLDSWCHLRDDHRDFTVSRIESVAPPRPKTPGQRS